MGAVAFPFIQEPSPADLREARVRAEVRGEADPGLHAMLIEELEDAVLAFNEKDAPLDFVVEPLAEHGVAHAARELVKLWAEADEKHDKALEEAKSEAAKSYDEMAARYDAMVDERNAWQDKAHAAEKALAAATRDGREIDADHLAKIRDQQRTIEILSRALLATVPEEALVVARAVLGIEEPEPVPSPAPSQPRKRVRRIK